VAWGNLSYSKRKLLRKGRLGPCRSCGNRQESICPQAHVELPPLNWHTDSLRLFDGQVTVPDGPTTNSVADSLFLLYVGAAIGGIAAGIIYGGSVGNALKWFPDRRGLAAGLTAAGFGAAPRSR
jgi:hypothetical protein